MDMNRYQPKALHLFGGCGGMIYGFARAGIRGTVANDLDADSCATMRANFPHMTVVEKPIEVCLLKDWGQERMDVHTVTYPCKNYTSAAHVHGHFTGDSLYAEALREGVLLFPEIICIENVLGMKKFRRVMETWLNLPGYYTTHFELDGLDFTLQRKERVILILHRQEYAFRPIEHYLPPRLGTRLQEYLDAPEQVDAWTRKANAYYEERAKADGERSYRDRAYIYQPDQEDPIPLFSNYRRDRSTYRVYDQDAPLGHRAFSRKEVARLHTFPENYTFRGGYNSVYKQLINSVMPSMAYAIGCAVMDYFRAIPSLAEQPKHRGYRRVVSLSDYRLVEQERQAIEREPLRLEGQEQMSLWSDAV